MHVIFYEEFLKDLKTTLKSLIKSSNFRLDPKVLQTFEDDRKKLYEAGEIHFLESTLCNDTKKFTKIAIASEDEYYKNQITYFDDEEMTFKYDRLYQEGYYSRITLILDNRVRKAIKEIKYDFSFGVYHPFGNKANKKVNKLMSTFALDCAEMQFKAIWICLYCNDLPTTQALKKFRHALASNPFQETYGNLHYRVEISDTITYKSIARVDFGTFDAMTRIIFDLPEEYLDLLPGEEEEDHLLEEQYLKSLYS